MRFLIRLILIASGVAALGLYLGWFHIEAGSRNGQSRVTIIMDKDKIQQDKDKAVGKAQDLAQDAKADAAAALSKSKRAATQSAEPHSKGSES